MNLTVTSPVIKRCPYVDEVDEGTVTLTFAVDVGDGPELHGLSRYLNGFANQSLSHEAFTRAVYHRTAAVEVESTWTTAGMTVTARVP